MPREKNEVMRARWEFRTSKRMAITVLVAMAAYACGGSAGSGDTAATTPATTGAPSTDSQTTSPSAAPATGTGETSPSPDTTVAAPPGFTYKVAIFSNPTTDNPWAYFDTEPDVWNQYTLRPTLPSLYGSAFPTFTIVPGLAADVEPPKGAADGNRWVIDVRMQPGAGWSDGTPITAHDVAFTFNAVKDLRMGGNWFAVLPMARPDDPQTEEDEAYDGLISVEALDDHTVRYTWSARPGLAQWQFGAAQAPIFSEAHWGPHVAASGDAGDLYAVSGIGAPSGGPMVYEHREPGAFVRTEANHAVFGRGDVLTSYSTGGATSEGAASWEVGDTSGEVLARWTEGPHAATAIYSVYDTQDAAVLALRDGEVDFMLNPLGLQRGLQATVIEAGDLDVISNASNGFRYVAFNTRRFPGSEPSFRQAIACIIDKEFMATNVLQGVAEPLDSLIPPGNTYWANPDVFVWCDGLSMEDRVDTAVRMLKDAGWTWEVEPQWDADSQDVIPQGEGLRGPDGTELEPMELLAPGPGYDPLRATYSLFIADWAHDLGIPLRAQPTGFSVIVDRVFGPVDWDMYMLGWSTTIFPDHLADFFETRNDSATTGGLNIPGYSNPEYDRLAHELKSATDLEEAAAIVREMDGVIAREVPYIVLFDTPTLEAYRNTLAYPATAVLNGLHGFHGLPGSVNLAE
ncbi:ABC transporter substrate-binding protein [Candidatus Spongiisocius sp.]|uniref:ABC transporter substrate-binding protein n=1 Tax=Candidatus Spongiisocius sp. TaxID=3101273 RepID=UPI003B5CECDA